MSFVKRSFILGAMLLTLSTLFTGVLWAEGISPAQEQEFSDARAALESARNAQADKYAPSQLKQAEDFLQTARRARELPDTAGFSRASLLARAYAEWAEALAEYEVNVEGLSATQETLQKAKAEIEEIKNKK